MAKLCALNFFIATAGQRLLGRLNVRAGLTAVFFAFAAFARSTNTSQADEGGVGFWISGTVRQLGGGTAGPWLGNRHPRFIQSGERGRECRRSATNHDWQFACKRKGQPQRYTEGTGRSGPC